MNENEKTESPEVQAEKKEAAELKTQSLPTDPDAPAKAEKSPGGIESHPPAGSQKDPVKGMTYQEYQEKQIQKAEPGVAEVNDDFVLAMPEIPEAGGEQTVIADTFDGAQNFAFLCAGAAGCRLGAEFARLGYGRYLLINTAEHDMAGLPGGEQNKLAFSAGGTGKDPEVGRVHAEENLEAIIDKMHEAFGDDIDRIMIIVGLGGGTGSGFAVSLRKAAKRYAEIIGLPEPHERRIGVIATLPDHMESPQVQANAYHSFVELLLLNGVGRQLDEYKKLEKKRIPMDQFSTFMILDNDAAQAMFPGASQDEYWKKVNAHFASLFHSFNLLANKKSPYETFDPPEYVRILENALVVFGAVKITQFDRTAISSAMRLALKTNFLARFDLSTADIAAAIAIGDAVVLHEVKREDIHHAFYQLQQAMRLRTLCPGIYVGDKPCLGILTIAGGLSAPRQRIAQMKRLGGVEEEKAEEEAPENPEGE